VLRAARTPPVATGPAARLIDPCSRGGSPGAHARCDLHIDRRANERLG